MSKTPQTLGIVIKGFLLPKYSLNSCNKPYFLIADTRISVYLKRCIKPLLESTACNKLL